MTNPVTGRPIPRSDLMKIYHYLCRRSVEKGSGILTGELLEICRKLLDISRDLQDEILLEMRTSPERRILYDAKPYVLDELEAIREGRLMAGLTSEPEVAPSRPDEDSRDGMDTDILELEKGSLIDQMEDVESVASLGNASSFSKDFSLGDLGPDVFSRKPKKREGSEE